LKLSTLRRFKKDYHIDVLEQSECSCSTTVDSREEGGEFEVTSFDKAFDLPTLGITVDLEKELQNTVLIQRKKVVSKIRFGL
ncbi:hypothetical protein Tco_0852110, partial [Tanacetum coccineum]